MPVRDRDLGWSRFFKAITALSKAEAGVIVGFPADSVDAETITIAASNEFGTETIPERSFFRSTLDDNRDRYLDSLSEAVGRAIDGEALDGALGRIGEVVVGDIKLRITDLRDPPNAASTIAAKGSSNPLIDTGDMRSRVTYKIVKGRRR